MDQNGKSQSVITAKYVTQFNYSSSRN